MVGRGVGGGEAALRVIEREGTTTSRPAWGNAQSCRCVETTWAEEQEATFALENLERTNQSSLGTNSCGSVTKGSRGSTSLRIRVCFEEVKNLFDGELVQVTDASAVEGRLGQLRLVRLKRQDAVFDRVVDGELCEGRMSTRDV